VRYDEVLRERVDGIERERAGNAPSQSVPTGLREMDKRGGIRRGVLTMVGAATGEGKDIFVLHLASAVAAAGHTADVISMEDPADRTADRTLATATGINSARLASPTELDEGELERVRLAAAESSEWASRVMWRTGLVHPEEVLDIVRGSDADLRVVNYLQALPEGARGLERTIADLCWSLNEIAQRDNCAVLAVSQVNVAKVEERGLRQLERSLSRDPQRPSVEGFAPWGPSDLAWCTAAGQRAKDLLFLFRPGRYLRRAGFPVADDRMEIRRPKSNFGAEGRMVVGFDPKTARLFDLPPGKEAKHE
jgi:replicative DNA helicase